MWKRYLPYGKSRRFNDKFINEKTGGILTFPYAYTKIRGLLKNDKLSEFKNMYKQVICLEQPDNSYSLYKVVIAMWKSHKNTEIDDPDMIIRITTRDLDELIKDKFSHKYYEILDVEKYEKYL